MKDIVVIFVICAAAALRAGAVGADEADYNTPCPVEGTMGVDAVTAMMERSAPLVRWSFRLFGEDRSRPVRTDIVPEHWFDGTATERSREFRGTAQPGEFYAFQVCVMGDRARRFRWEIRGDCPSMRVTPAECEVREKGLKPLWAMLFVPKDAAGRTLRGAVAVKDAASGEERTIGYAVSVKGAVLEDGGVSDAGRLARLAWLESAVGRSDAAPTRPFTPVAVDRATRTLGILGRELVLAENGLPGRYRTRFNGSATGFADRWAEVLAEPVAMDLPAFAAGAKWAFAFAEVTPCRVAWTAECRDAATPVTVRGALEFDGAATFDITVGAAKEGGEFRPALRFVLPAERARYQMGLGRRGGDWPDEAYDWQWADGLHQDAAWFGDVSGGLMVRLRDAVRRRPLINCYHKWKPLVQPEAWRRGGVGFRRDGVRATVTATGAFALAAGESRTFGFDLFLTPFKPVDLKRHLADRYAHFGQKQRTVDFARYARDGVTIQNIHHNTLWNPYINYPYNDDGGPLLKKMVAEAHKAGLRTGVYYTTRELTQNLPEFFALMSLDGEVLFRRPEAVKGWPLTNPRGPHEWLTQHVGNDILPAWREEVSFEDAYPRRLDLALITNPDSERWNNFYLAGLDLLVREYGIDGIYIDDTALDRVALQRARRILDADGNPGRRIDMHSWSHFCLEAGMLPSDICFMELYPYFDRIWHGEGFDPQYGSPAFWLIERSGLAWGVGGEELGKGNPWKGLLFAQTDRFGWGGNPQPWWRLFDSVRLGEAEMTGFWQKECPVKLEGAPDCRATYYRTPCAEVVAIANFGERPEWALLKGFGAKASLPAVEGFQKAGEVDLARPLDIPKQGGAVLMRALHLKQ